MKAPGRRSPGAFYVHESNRCKLSCLCAFEDQIQKCEGKRADLADQKSPQIAIDSDLWNKKIDAENTDGKTDGVDSKWQSGFTDSVNNADQCIVCI